MVEIMATDEESAGTVRKESGRKGQRLTSFQRAADEHGKVHPDMLDEDNQIEGLLVTHEEYIEMCEADENLPDKKLTDGVKSGAKNRYGIKFGRTISGDTHKYMIIPNDSEDDSPNFEGVMTEAQEAVNEEFGSDDEEPDEDPDEAEADADSEDSEDEEEEDEE